MTLKSRTALIVLILAVLGPGCSWEPPRYAATGAVTIDGVPAPYVSVKFFPVSPNSLTGGSGSTDATGKFSIGESGKNTGFPAGEYKVAFSQAVMNGKPMIAGGGGKKNPEETLPSEREGVADDYRDPQKTPITATIISSTNNFTFDIKAKK